jgi:hypothetical protein
MLGEFLRRFREGGVPGAPAAAGAPGDPAAAAEAELTPVFALLADAEREADTIGAEGRRRAALARVAAAERARALVANAHARAAGDRAAAAATRLASSEEACTELRRQGAAESARIDDAVALRARALVDELVERVLSRAGTAAAL